MHTNIIAFPVDRITPPVRFDEKTYDKVVSLARWRNEAHPHRTSNGVYFVSQVLAGDGDSA